MVACGRIPILPTRVISVLGLKSTLENPQIQVYFAGNGLLAGENGWPFRRFCGGGGGLPAPLLAPRALILRTRERAGIGRARVGVPPGERRLRAANLWCARRPPPLPHPAASCRGANQQAELLIGAKQSPELRWALPIYLRGGDGLELGGAGAGAGGLGAL